MFAPHRTSRSLALVAVVASLAGGAALSIQGCGSAPASASKAPTVNLDFEKYTLPNGLDVILRRDPRLPIVGVNLWYHVGPANEGPGRTGFAHLFEHMMFQGSGHVEDDAYFRHLESAGASLVNGTTDFDRTNYLEDVPSNQLELALWLESDRMGFLLDRLDARMLANQQDVVRNERRQSVENAPYQMAEEELFHRLFPASHPYHAWVIGSHEDIQAAKLEDVRDFFSSYYRPNNASLAIVGDIDIEKTKALVEKYFGSIARGPDVPRPQLAPPVIDREIVSTVKDQVELPRVYNGWITAPIFKPGDAEAHVTAQILGGGKASRLFRSLVYERQIAQTVNASQQSLALGSVFQVQATAKPGRTLDEIQAAIDAQLDSLARFGPTPEELAAAKTAISAEIVTSLENLGGFDGVADRFNMYNHHLGNPGYLNEDLARYGAVTAEQVKQVAAQQLTRDHRVVVRAEPGAKTLPAGPPTPALPAAGTTRVASAEPWRSEKPGPGPTPVATLPSARTFSLPNGLKVYLVEAHALPVVAAHVAIRAGSADDPVAQPGVASFVTAMLDEGTTTRDALGIARELEAMGADLSANTISDGSFISVRALKNQAQPAFDVLADLVTNATFPEAEVERVRHQRRVQILQERDSPIQTALRVTTACLFGPEHPYGHVASGTEESVEKMSRADLETFYRAQFTPDNAALVLVGDLSEAEARRLASRAFGAWKGKHSGERRKVAPRSVAEPVVIVDRPGSPQTLVLMGQVAVQRSDPDFEKLDLMNQVLGGLFSSRLNLNLREQNGYSYGAFSAMVERRDLAPLYAGAAVRGDVTGASVKEALGEVRGMIERPVTDDELKMAKEFAARSLPALFQTTETTGGTMAQLYLLDLPADYYRGLPARLEGMTREDLAAVTRKHLKPDAMRIITVGDRAKIEPQLAALKLGAIAYRTPDGKPVESRNVAALRERKDVEP